jgi:5'-phosphate synthase pdxT subunit
MPVGILALQGAFAEHVDMFRTMGVDVVLVRTAERLSGLSGLVLPGGESTSMRRLAAMGDLDQAIREFAAARPVWGVCAGLVLLAARIEGEEPVLGVMDMTVARNAYGRQQDSFMVDLRLPVLGESPFPGLFIRAPRVTGVGPGVDVLARLEGSPVALRHGHLLVTTFHPELTGDTRMHRYFLDICACADVLPARR